METTIETLVDLLVTKEYEIQTLLARLEALEQEVYRLSCIVKQSKMSRRKLIGFKLKGATK